MIPKTKAQTCILGAMIGDSLGTTMEFSNRSRANTIITYHNNFADGLVGQGPFHLLPGQFTDDTEMALANMYIIDKYGKYNQRLVADAYHHWYLSNPFDMGNTTKNAISKDTTCEMLIAAKTVNVTSLSNGSLMRLPGLIAMLHNKTSEDFIMAIFQDIELTHGHPEMHIIALVYSMMLKRAIQGMSAADVYEWGKNNCNPSLLFKAVYNAVETNDNKFQYNECLYYFDQIDSKFCGFVGYAIWLLLICLKQFRSYRDAMLYIISQGGDTDTNACIVGAVMGALYPDTIPIAWINSIIQFSKSSCKRFTEYAYAKPELWMNRIFG